MFYTMEEQTSHIAKLMEENRKYIQENGHLKKGRSRGASHAVSSGAPYDLYEDERYREANNGVINELEDKVLALRLQNSELNLSLEREKRLRKEAEAKMQRDQGYIKRLEDSVQTLRGSRVIMDQNTYRQVAEAYMAAKRTPARRPHTHNGFQGSDLVCDATHSNRKNPHSRLSHPTLHQTSSCPLSPDTSSPVSPKERMYPSLESHEEYPLYHEGIGQGKVKDRNQQDRGNLGLGIGGGPMNPWDYQQLLEDLEDLNGNNRGSLS